MGLGLELGLWGWCCENPRQTEYFLFIIGFSASLLTVFTWYRSV